MGCAAKPRALVLPIASSRTCASVAAGRSRMLMPDDTGWGATLHADVGTRMRNPSCSSAQHPRRQSQHPPRMCPSPVHRPECSCICRHVNKQHVVWRRSLMHYAHSHGQRPHDHHPRAAATRKFTTQQRGGCSKRAPIKMASSVLTRELVLERGGVEDMKDVKKLNLWGLRLTDISCLREATELTVASLPTNNLASLAEVSCCTKLSELYVRRRGQTPSRIPRTVPLHGHRPPRCARTAPSLQLRKNRIEAPELGFLARLPHLRILWLAGESPSAVTRAPPTTPTMHGHQLTLVCACMPACRHPCIQKIRAPRTRTTAPCACTSRGHWRSWTRRT